MLKDKSLSIAIYFLSISIVISAVIIRNGMKTSGNYISSGFSSINQGLNNIGANISTSTNNDINRRDTLNLFTASAYLGISESRLKQLVDEKDSAIPFVKIGDSYIFSKGAIDKWLQTTRLEMN